MSVLNSIQSRIIEQLQSLSKLTLIIWGVNILFISYYLMLGYYNVPATDDYDFQFYLEEYGFWGSIYKWYTEWNGRVSTLFGINVILPFYFKLGSFLPATILFLYFFSRGVYQLSKKIAEVNALELSSEKANLLAAMATYFACSYLMISLDPTTLFWTVALCPYYISLVTAIWGAYFVLSDNFHILKAVGVFLLFFYSGGSTEVYGLMVSGVLWLSFVILSVFKLPITNHLKGLRIYVLLAALGASIAFLLMFFAPGNDVRQAQFKPSGGVVDAFILGAKLTYHMITILKDHIGFMLLYSFPFILLGSGLKSNGSTSKYLDRFVLYVLVLAPTLIFLLYVSMVPMAYGIGAIGPFRSFSYNLIILYISISFLFFGLGYYVKISVSLSGALTLAILIPAGFLLLAKIPIHQKQVSIYRKAELERQALIQKKKQEGFQGNLLLEPLPNIPEFVKTNEMTTDTTHWKNVLMKRALKLPFTIQLDPSKAVGVQLSDENQTSN